MPDPSVGVAIAHWVNVCDKPKTGFLLGTNGSSYRQLALGAIAPTPVKFVFDDWLTKSWLF